ncbi:hypothetical protein [Bacillus pacificus]|nr:hypothetical protein [Bacillus pacificus]MDF0736476.1 hypothetical protein [Bacillus pacificus]
MMQISIGCNNRLEKKIIVEGNAVVSFPSELYILFLCIVLIDMERKRIL